MAWVSASHPFLPSTLTWGGASSGCNLTPVLQVVPLVVWWWGTRRPKTFRSTECLHGQLDLSLRCLWAGVTVCCSYFCVLMFIWMHTLMAQYSHPGPFSCLSAWLTPTTMQATPAQSPNWFQTFPSSLHSLRDSSSSSSSLLSLLPLILSISLGFLGLSVYHMCIHFDS